MAGAAPPQSAWSSKVSQSLLRASVELEGRPIEGLAEDASRADQRELSIAEGGRGVLARPQAFVQFIHQFRRGIIVDLPQRGDDIVRACAEEGPGQADEACAGITALANSIASG